MQPNKNQAEIMDKLKQMMLAYKTDLSKKFITYNGNSKFIIANENGYDVISLNVAKMVPNSKIITDEECFNILENYLFNTNANYTPIKVFLIGQRNFNHVTSILMKNSSDEELQNKLINLFFNTKNESVFDNFIEKIDKAIRQKSFDSAYGKKLVFKVLNQIGKSGKLPGFEMEEFSKLFPDIMKKLSKFDINESDYPTLHNVCKYYQIPIKDSYMATSALENFLKNKIPTKNWGQFKEYFKKDNYYSIGPAKTLEMFEENINPKLHLNISEKTIKDKYPVLSIGSDYHIMMNNIIKGINSTKESFGLESCQSISNTHAITTFYCLSKNENPIDSHKIRSVIQSTIDLYAEAKERKQDFSEKDLITVFKANILSYELEKGSLNQEVKQKMISKI